MNDGMSKEEFQECKDAFNLFDHDNDGRVHCKELGTLLRALRRSPTEAQIAEYSAHVADPTSHHFTFDDFHRLLLTIPPTDIATVEKELMDAFSVFDKEGKGYIGTGELRRIVTTLGDKLSEQEADEMCKEADPEGTGNVEYSVFVKKLLYS